MMFQSYALFPHLDMRDNVAFSLKMNGVDKATRRARAMEMLKLVQMELWPSGFRRSSPAASSSASRSPARSSPIRRSCCSTSRCRRSIRSSSIKVRQELKTLQHELGISFIHVTHSQEEAMALADLVVVMNDGRIEQAGRAARGLQRAAHRIRRPLHGRPQRHYGRVTKATKAGVEFAVPGGGTFTRPRRTSKPASRSRSRSERPREDRAPPKKGCGMTGLVQNVEYHGQKVQVSLERAGHRRLRRAIPEPISSRSRFASETRCR